MAWVVEILPVEDKDSFILQINTMGADGLVTQGVVI